MSMKRIFVLCAGLLMALCIGVMSSCGPGDSGTTEEPLITDLSGTWQSQDIGTPTRKLTFDAKNFQYQTVVVIYGNTTTPLYFSGTYSVSGRTVTFTFTGSSSDNWEEHLPPTTAKIKSQTELEYAGSLFKKSQGFQF